MLYYCKKKTITVELLEIADDVLRTRDFCSFFFMCLERGLCDGIIYLYLIANTLRTKVFGKKIFKWN